MHDHNRLKFDKNRDVSDGERMFHNYLDFKLRRFLTRRPTQKWLYHHSCGTWKECCLVTLEDTQNWTRLDGSHQEILCQSLLPDFRSSLAWLLIDASLLLPIRSWSCARKGTSTKNSENLTLNPLTPRSDSHVTSPNNIHTLSSKQVMRILKLIR